MGRDIIWAIVLCGCVPHLAWAEPPPTSPPPRCVAIMGTNDGHGALEPYTVYSSTPKLTAKTGGVMAASGYAKNLREVFGRRSLIVDAGDIFQGTMASNMSLGKAMIATYNRMQYDAAAIGNHEFDFGALPGQDANIVANRLGVLQARIAEAEFPFLAVNIFDRDTQAPIAWKNVTGSVLKDLDGIKVGIIGASTPTTPSVTLPHNVLSLQFRPPAPLVLAEARRLREQGAELIVLVAHMGGRCGEPHHIQAAADPFDLSDCALEPQQSELVDLLQALPAGTIDVAIGGHTHQFIAHWINGVATLESGAQGHYMGWMEACLSPAGSGGSPQVHIDRHTTAIHGAVELCLQTWDDATCWANVATTAVWPAMFLQRPVVPMDDVQQEAAPYINTVAALSGRSVGAFLPTDVGKPELTRWTAEAMRRVTHSDFGLQNRGGVRTDLRAGEVRYGTIFSMLPFDNFVAQVELSGAQLSRLILHLAHYQIGPTGPSLVGLRLQQGPDGLEVVTDKGRPLVPTRLYTLSTTDFLLTGGDGADAVFREVPMSRIHYSTLIMREAFIRFLRQAYPSARSQQG